MGCFTAILLFVNLWFRCPYTIDSDPYELWWHLKPGYWALTYQVKTEDGVLLPTGSSVGHFNTDVEAQAECDKRNAKELDTYYEVIPVIQYEGDHSDEDHG